MIRVLSRNGSGMRLGLRRAFLKWSGITVASLAGVDQLPRLAEVVPPRHSELVFDQRQLQRLGELTSACIVMPGMAFRSPDLIINWGLPALEPLGAVGGVKYAKDGLDAPAIGDGFQKLKEFGINEFSIYAHSIGAQAAGMGFEHMKFGPKLKHLFLDGTPPSISYTDQAGLATFFNDLPYDGGAFITSYTNYKVFDNPIQTGSAYPGLLRDQLASLGDGEKYLQSLAKVAERDNTKVTFLTPVHPESDSLTDAAASRLRLQDFFPDMKTIYIGGPHEQHGISEANKSGYRTAITQAINIP